MFAGESGIYLLDPKQGQPFDRISDLGAWQLRWSDDESVLGANLSNIRTQTSILQFFVMREGHLEPALALEFDERVDGWDLSSDGSSLALTYYPSNTVEYLSLKDRTLHWTAPAPPYGGALDISPDDTRIAVGGEHVVIFDAQNPARSAAYKDFGNNINRVLFSPPGDALAVSSYDGRIRILGASLDDSPLRLLNVLRHQGTANVYALQFIDGGAGLISSSGDQTVRFWAR